MSVSLSAQNVVKRYGGVVALSGANLDVQTGEVVALIGANGSGKSTLSKIINGVVALDGGRLLLDGRPAAFRSPGAARKAGISTVFQELSLIPTMTVAENIWLTREPLAWGGIVNAKRVREKTNELLALFEGTYKTALTPDMPVGDLPPDEKQIIEILKAVSSNPRLLILDEATASLDSRQVQRLFDLVQRWKEEGKAVIFVSHRMEEIFQVAERYTVLRNGITVGEGLINEVSPRDLIALMAGSAVKAAEEAGAILAAEPAAAPQAQPAAETGQPAGRGPSEEPDISLEVKDLKTSVLKGVSFTLREGELLGIGGLMGQGQRDLLHALFGDTRFTGSVCLGGRPVHFTHPQQAVRAGVALVPGERSREGLLAIRSILENLQLPNWRKYGLITRIKQAYKDAGNIAKSLQLVMESLDQPVSSLSGGNAQKVVIGKWLLQNPRLLLLDDPTKGVDVNTKAEFYRLLADLSRAGLSVILYSSDDEELIRLCSRVLVLHDGTVYAELSGPALTKANLVAASLGTR